MFSIQAIRYKNSPKGFGKVDTLCIATCVWVNQYSNAATESMMMIVIRLSMTMPPSIVREIRFMVFVEHPVHHVRDVCVICPTLPRGPLMGDNIFDSYNDPEFHLYRMDNFMVELGYYFKRAFNHDNNNGDVFPSINPLGLVPLPNLTVLEEVMDFARFRGCQSFSYNMEILGDGIPDLIPVNFRGDALFRPNDLVDQILCGGTTGSGYSTVLAKN